MAICACEDGWYTKILDHYADKKIMNGNVVNLEKYKQLMALE